MVVARWDGPVYILLIVSLPNKELNVTLTSGSLEGSSGTQHLRLLLSMFPIYHCNTGARPLGWFSGPQLAPFFHRRTLPSNSCYCFPPIWTPCLLRNCHTPGACGPSAQPSSGCEESLGGACVVLFLSLLQPASSVRKTKPFSRL